MVVTIVLAAVVAVAILLVVVATRPGSFRLQRTTTVAAPAEVIFAQLADLRRWTAWNPFEKRDPGARVVHAGEAGSIGSSYHFVGPKMGEGRMTLTALDPDERVAVEAQFIKPFQATNTIEFLLSPVADGVAVTWAMHGRQTFVGKALSLVMSMDRMMGPIFDSGLADLKRLSEDEAERLWAGAPAPRGPRRTTAG